MIDGAAGAALYGSVFLVVRYMTLASKAANEGKMKTLPRPKSFLLSEKSTGVKEDIAC